jgi:hypothetical protein
MTNHNTTTNNNSTIRTTTTGNSRNRMATINSNKRCKGQGQ